MNLQVETLELEPEEMEGRVAEYLATHPDFFERNRDLLLELKLPHANGGAISLIERQLAQLREKCANHQKQMDQLLETGRKNDLLISKLHQLTLALIETQSFDELLNVLEDHLHHQFEAEAVELRLFSPADLADPSSLSPEEQEGLSHFKSFFQKKLPLCGRITQGQHHYLFGADNDDIQSVALLPVDEENIAGMLAIGSGDEGRFHYDMGTEFLRRLAEIVGRRLELFSEPGA